MKKNEIIKRLNLILETDINTLKGFEMPHEPLENEIKALKAAIELIEQEPIDKSAMMCEIYMEGVNMTGEYQGCWVRFKNIEKIIDKYIPGSEG